MTHIGYRFKMYEDECWAYTYDIVGSKKGGGLKLYSYVDKIYVEDK